MILILRIVTIPFFILIVFGIILPNLLNSRERAHFSDEKRMDHARRNFHVAAIKDTISTEASNFYANRSSIHHKLLGKKNRELWNTKIEIPVFHLRDSLLNYWCHSIGGGDQTIKINLEDNLGRVWALRSIDKDQSKALHPILQYTFLRPLVRDETAAMNPYGALVADDLAEAVGIPHTNPRLVFVPYFEKLREDCRLKMAGRVAIMEEELDEPGWTSNYSAEQLVKTDDMLAELLNRKDRSIDTLGYLKARLFDILISDWDRHEGQWVWALKNNVYYPIPVDRDMAFYLFDDGVVNRLFLFVNNKFRSFHPDYKDISGFVKNSRLLDTMLLGKLPEQRFITSAGELQQELTSEETLAAFKEYPQEIFQRVGQQHIQILEQRKAKLKMAAKEFFTAIQKSL